MAITQEHLLTGIENLIESLNNTIHTMVRSDLEVAFDRISAAQWQVQEWLLSDVEPDNTASRNLSDLLGCLGNIKDVVCTRWNEIAPTGVGTLLDSGTVENTHSPGRPPYSIDIDTVSFLLYLGFSKTTIAKMCMMSRTTLWRKLVQAGYSDEKYTNVSDEELDGIIAEINRQNPHNGAVIVSGHLRSRGIVVQRQRIRESLKRIDPVNSALRWNMVARRRSYNVRAAQSLYHMDGHHSLIRWRFVVHGCIDGFSRLIVYLNCSENNRAATVLDLFKGAVDVFGLPSRVRADKGVENVDVKRYMIEKRGANRGSFIEGKSVFNSRIERLWRDVFYSVNQTYYSLFYYMEGQGYLNIEDDIDLLALRITYMWRINTALNEFADAYNNHPMRTERNWTPIQMWSNSMMKQENDHLPEVQGFDVEVEGFGIDTQGPFPLHVHGARENRVVVPQIETPAELTPAILNHIKGISLNANVATDNYGIDSLGWSKKH